MLRAIAPQTVQARYKGDIGDRHDLELLADIGKQRGFKLQGGSVDMERAAVTVIREFRDGKLGRITLEKP